MIWIPGWIFKIHEKRFKRYRISLDYPMSIDSLRYYIKKGEYSIDIPFSIFLDENKELGIILRDIDIRKDFSFLISSNLIRIHDEITEEWSDYQSKSFGLFIKLYIEYLIVTRSHGAYTPANEVRSCLRKYSKGRISKRAEPIDSIEADYPYKTIYELCEAEEFGIINNGNEEFLLTYVPRYEICDSILNFPQNEFILERINEKWEDFYHHTKEKFQNRFKFISNLITNLLINDNYVEITETTNLFQDETLNYPVFESFTCDGNRSFKDVLKREILNQIKEKLPLRIMIDKTVELPEESEKVLNNYLDNLDDLFDVKLIEDLRLKSEDVLNSEDFALEFNDSSTVNTLIILNNLEPGSQSIYDEIKKRILNPHKIITLKTILESNDFEIQHILIYLSLKFRNNNKNYLKIKNDERHVLIAFNIAKHFDLGYCCVFSSSLIDQEHVVNHVLLPLTYDNHAFIEERASEFIFAELRKIKNQIQNKKIIVTYKNNLDLKTYVKLAIREMQEISVAEILDIPFKMFKVSNDKIELPKNGTYFIISKGSKHSRICLISNGFPDLPEKGIPNPILLKINSKNNSTISNIMNSIFSHTFLHPTSLIKPNLPIELHQILNIFNLPIMSILNQDYKRYLL